MLLYGFIELFLNNEWLQIYSIAGILTNCVECTLTGISIKKDAPGRAS